MNQVRTQQLASLTTWLLLVFLLCSLLGRFGVALLGFAFTIEDNSVYEAPILRPDWANGTLNWDNTVRIEFEKEVGLVGHESGE